MTGETYNVIQDVELEAGDPIDTDKAKYYRDNPLALWQGAATAPGLPWAPKSRITFTSSITPAQITADQDDYSPTNLESAVVLRLSTDASRTITGLAARGDGEAKLIQNVGSNDLVLANQNASSVAANRFALESGNNETISAGGQRWIIYDGTSSRWRLSSGGSGGSSLPVDDSTALVQDPADNTKLVRIDAGAIATGTTRIITMGDRDVDLASGGTFAEVSHAATHTNGTDDIQSATAAQKGLMTATQAGKLDGIESGATADQSDAEIAAAYANEVAAASQVEMEAGTESAIRRMSPLRVKQAIDALAGGSGVTIVTVTDIDDPSTELNARAETNDGDLILAEEANGLRTLYAWRSSAVTEDVPYTVDGSSGHYEALAGGYVHSAQTLVDLDHGLRLDQSGGMAILSGTEIYFTAAGGGPSLFKIKSDGLYYSGTQVVDISGTGGITIPATKTITMGGHSVDDIKVAADADSTADDELVTPGYLNARRASQAEMEAATSTTQHVTPGRQHHHPAHPTAWALWNGAASASLTSDYGVTSLTDNGTGDVTITLDDTYSPIGGMVPMCTAGDDGAVTSAATGFVFDLTSTSVRCRIVTAASGGLVDGPNLNVMMLWGDL